MGRYHREIVKILNVRRQRSLDTNESLISLGEANLGDVPCPSPWLSLVQLPPWKKESNGVPWSGVCSLPSVANLFDLLWELVGVMLLPMPS